MSRTYNHQNDKQNEQTRRIDRERGFKRVTTRQLDRMREGAFDTLYATAPKATRTYA